MANHVDLVRQVKKAAFLEGEFVTRSGKKTNYYIDKYLFETQPEILDAIADAIVALLPDSSTYDRLAAPELGAVSLAALVSVKAKKPFVIVRKGAKGYGTSNLLEGAYQSGERVVVVEDVLTTGGAVLNACHVLKEEGLTIHKIIGVVNREEGAFENIQNEGFDVSAVLTTSDLLAC